MKHALTMAAVLLLAAPVMAEEPWIQVGSYETSKLGKCLNYARQLTPSGRYRTIELRDDCHPFRITKAEADCQERKIRFLGDESGGGWWPLDSHQSRKVACK